MTKAIIDIATPLGISVLDHIAVGKNGHARLEGLKLIPLASSNTTARDATAARFLLSQGYNSQRLLIVRLQGADYELLRAPLASAMPVVNATPASQATRSIFHKSQHGS
jgi:hypothetical protein